MYIAHEGEQVAPNISLLYLKKFFSRSLFRKNLSASWSSDRMTACMNIASLSPVTAILYCRNLKRSPTRLHNRSGPAKRALLGECPLYTEAAFVTRLIQFLWLVFSSVFAQRGDVGHTKVVNSWNWFDVLSLQQILFRCLLRWFGCDDKISLVPVEVGVQVTVILLWQEKSWSVV